MLDLRHLQALHAVVDTGSVRAAAAALGYTPSAISQHVAALQRDTGAVLLERHGRGVRPTPAGLLLAHRAGDLLSHAAETETALAALLAGESGILRVASFATAGAELIPPALAAVRANLPNLQISVRVVENEDALSLLRNGALDLAVVEAHEPADGQASADEDDLIRHPLTTDPFRLVLPAAHPLADRDPLELADTATQPWISVRCEIGCCRAATQAAFNAAGFTPRRTVEADEYWPAQGFVAAGLGLALIPRLALGILHPGVTVRALPPATQPVRHILAITRPGLDRTLPVQTMLAGLHATTRLPRPALTAVESAK
jgi:DNA-binding transcriptional LysR family regulator